MTVLVTVKTNDKGAIVTQNHIASFDGEVERDAIDGIPVAIPPNTEMQFTAHFGLAIVVTEDVG